MCFENLIVKIFLTPLKWQLLAFLFVPNDGNISQMCAQRHNVPNKNVFDKISQGPFISCHRGAPWVTVPNLKL